MSKFNEKFSNEALIPKNIIFPSISQSSGSYRERFTKKEWNINNDVRRKIIEDQQKIADRVLKECERIKNQTEERTRINREATERRITERLENVAFNTEELNLKRKEICLELEALKVYRTRLINCLESLQENSLKPSEKCMQIREYRIGIDLVIDDVDVALQKEIMTILTWHDRLQATLEQTEEAMRRLRAVRYIIDSDLEHKDLAVDIENETANMKHTELSLKKMKITNIMDPAKILRAEWEVHTAKNIQNATKELHSIRPIRMMTDLYLQQVSEDLRSVYMNCNHAIKIRISEIRKVKSKLEEMLSETYIKIEAMTENIDSLQKALDDKFPYMALANKRLQTRAQRPGVELVKDAVCQSLYAESEMIRLSSEQLHAALQEAQTSLRHLTQAKVNLLEDIKVKTNSLQIDECECINLRETMTHFEF